jgi:hypothetical protein
MSNPTDKLSISLAELAETLDASDEVKTNDDSSAVLVMFDGSQHRIGAEDCAKFFASKKTVGQFCDLIPSPDETSVELFAMTLPEESLFELEARLMSVEEK